MVPRKLRGLLHHFLALILLQTFFSPHPRLYCAAPLSMADAPRATIQSHCAGPKNLGQVLRVLPCAWGQGWLGWR